MKPRDTSADGALFGSDLWQAALEKYASATHLTVTLFGADGRAVFGPVHPTPLFQLFDEAGYDPGIVAECARRCVAQTRQRPPVLVSQFHGLAVVGASLGLEGEIVGAAVGGYAFADFSQVSEIQRLAQQSGIVFERVWEIARKQPPVPQQRLIVHGELLQVLGDALLRENYRTRQYEQAAAIVDSSDDAIFSEDLSGVITTWNNGAERLYGYAAHEAIGRPITMLVPPDRQQEGPENLARIVRGESIDHFETVRVRKDGSPLEISLTISPIRNYAGQVIGASKIARDITERRRAEAALRESEARYRTLFDATHTPYLVLAPDPPRFTITDVNSAYLHTTMTGRETLVGRSIFEAFPDNPDDPNATGVRNLKASLGRALATRQPDAMAVQRYDIRRPDGSFEERHWSPFNTPMLNFAGEPVGIIHHVEDVSEYVRLRTRGAERDQETERLEGEIVASGRRLQQANDALRESEGRLAKELAAMRQLQGLSALVFDGGGIAALYEKIVEVAIAIMNSDFASIQMHYPGRGSGGELQLLARRGFNSQAAKYWEWVRSDSPSTCGAALRTGKRVIVPDVERCDFMAGTEDLKIYLQTGIHAMQTTPLVSRAGNLLGMISTHWRTPHTPTEGELVQFDVLARQAADLIERKQAAQRQQLLMNELAHRGRNLLAVIQTIVSRSLSGTRSLAEGREALTQRIQALARSQSVLVNGGFEGTPLDEIIRLEFEGFSDRIKASGPDVTLNPKAAQTFALLTHELATNATKYGALSQPSGRIAISWSIEDEGVEARLRFRWQECDGPPTVPPAHQGFGRILIEKAVAQDFGGQPKISYAPEGLSYEIDAPLSAVAASGGERQFLSPA